MADIAAATEKKEGVLASAGAPVRAEFPGQKRVDKALADNADAVDEKKEPAKAEVKSPAAPAEINDDAIKEYFKKQGIDYGGVDDLKKKLTPKEEYKEPTPEEKEKAAKIKEKRLLDLHIGRGGTPEQFVNYQKQAAGDPAELGTIKLKADLKAAGFSDEKLDSLIKKMHLDVSEEELATLEPDEQAEIKKEREFGLKKLNSRGTIYKQMAADYIKDLEREATDQDTEVNMKKTHASNVEAAISGFQRKENIELGEVNDEKVLPYEFEFPEAVITQAHDFLKDRAKLESQFLNKDGSFNLDVLTPLIIKSFAYNNVAKTSYLEGNTRGVESALKNFSSKPVITGTNGSDKKGIPGKLQSAGQPQKANFPGRK